MQFLYHAVWGWGTGMSRSPYYKPLKPISIGSELGSA